MLRDRKWLDFQHYNMSCCICNKSGDDIVAHHIRKGTYCGTGLKPSDDMTVPVCYIHHTEIHTKGEEKTFKKYGYSIEEIKEFARLIYDKYKKIKKNKKKC